jgi:hypothetical protein
MAKPRLFRCYRCRQLRNGKPVWENGGLKLCALCLAESKGERVAEKTHA